jgi:DNA gyrase inhibitor GyrI
MKDRKTWVLVTLFTALLTACAPLASVDPVLDRAEAALGGKEALEGIDAFRLRGNGTWSSPHLGFPPLPYEVEIVFQLPDRYRWEIRPAMGEPMSMGFDGQDAWGRWSAPPARYRGWMGQMVREAPAELRARLVLPARREEGTPLVLTTPDPTGDPPAYEVSYTPAAGGEWILRFDAVSGHLVGMAHGYYFMDGEPMDGRLEWSEPRTFDGITLPSVTRYRGTRGAETLEVIEETVTAIEWNPEIPDGFFSCPETGIEADTVATRTLAPMIVVTLRHVGAYEEMSASMDRLMEGVFAAGLMPMGGVHGTYHDDPRSVPPDELRTDLSVPVMIMGETPELPEGFSVQQWPETKVAYTYHLGEPAGEGEAHARLWQWMAETGGVPAGPPRAIWFHDPEITVPEDQVTEVQVPIR